MENMGSFKELYDVCLKTITPIEIANKTFEAGEVVARFDKIQIAGFEQIKDVVAAKGGFDNRAHVFWETTKELQLSFSQGVFSKTHFGLLSNSRLIIPSEEEKISISIMEELESNEDGAFTLKEKPLDKVFVYDKSTGEKLSYNHIKDLDYQIEKPFTDLIIDYNYIYDNNVTIYKIGRRLIEGFLSFEGKTKIKDENNGRVITGIIKIPKLKMLSDLSIRLGAQANPVVANFFATGIPVGTRQNSYVSEIYFLDNDISSDI